MALVLVVVVTAGLYWFQPWKIVTDREVAESLTVVGVPSSSPDAQPLGSATPAGPVLVRQGEFISHEHDTTGLARVIRDPDGSHTLEIAGLDTSDGPDLRVWLSDQPVLPGTAGWRVFDDGASVELGRLKGNRGDQAYVIPPGTDLDRLTSVTIWCVRFSVSFGAADLA
ncbi:DM13 domain-containing protein [Catenuloplanes japonicus]|uniref:DM13 domain-containing protein n=1 Tax=Catenuloplanes japonicus TaxID=33876 RepID=UPI000A10E4DA|nr:DM13 domain-containing protein [Catenuloplanes japonicus]